MRPAQEICKFVPNCEINPFSTEFNLNINVCASSSVKHFGFLYRFANLILIYVKAKYVLCVLRCNMDCIPVCKLRQFNKKNNVQSFIYLKHTVSAKHEFGMHANASVPVFTLKNPQHSPFTWLSVLTAKVPNRMRDWDH